MLVSRLALVDALCAPTAELRGQHRYVCGTDSSMVTVVGLSHHYHEMMCAFIHYRADRSSSAGGSHRAAHACARIVCHSYKTLVVQTTDLALTHNDGSLLPSAERGTAPEPHGPSNDQRGASARTCAFQSPKGEHGLVSKHEAENS